jgi:hypothetical protein
VADDPDAHGHSDGNPEPQSDAYARGYADGYTDGHAEPDPVVYERMRARLLDAIAKRDPGSDVQRTGLRDGLPGEPDADTEPHTSTDEYDRGDPAD